MFKKLLSLFKDESELEKDKRSKFRFEVKYIEELCIDINSKKYNLKEISLEGLSFYISEKDNKTFEKGTKHKSCIEFKDSKVMFYITVMSHHNGLIGCKVTSGVDQYNDFVTGDLSIYLTSYLS